MTTWGAGRGEAAATGERRRSSRIADLDAPRGAPSAPPAGRDPDPHLQRLVPDRLAEARREFAVLLGGFRRTAVLVPLADGGGLWTADLGGVRWICAFSHEESLARFARARGEAGRVWEYRTVLGARLLDAMVPLLGVPGGVVLDAGGADGVLFPPVRGVVPDAVAVDLDDEREGGLHER
ncbi:SseB family protein [Streptomyces somaliensis DSM 40738]|uniref:SseB family protein n=1 Tax=Streptomyces somaliensis TaxID=78355 RepID=UPI0021C4A5BD|nr:SseB family protein [Streptomyces somaliensis]MCQ0023386.1 SseB family protein [Streptomyces somaliensis DSM 40738]